jgi:hypothetical protein
LALLSKEAATRDYQAQWKRIFREAQELEGILACADSEWYYGRFEPQVYRTQSATFEEPEQFFNELTRLVALSSYTFESLAAAYESKGCSRDGVRAAVQAGRAAHERLRQPLKGIAEGDR